MQKGGDSMRLGDIVVAANTLADETFSPSQLVQFINDAISKINIMCGATFPFMSIEDTTDYQAFPDKWQRALFVPFVVGRMKAVDSSQFEYNTNYGEFQTNLSLFQVKYEIPDQYVDSNEARRFDDDLSTSPWQWLPTGMSNDPWKV